MACQARMDAPATNEIQSALSSKNIGDGIEGGRKGRKGGIMRRLLLQVAFVFFLGCLIPGCATPGPPAPSPGFNLSLKVTYSPEIFMPDDDVTFTVEIKNVGTNKIEPRPTYTFSYTTRDKNTVIARAPEAPPYTGLAPGASIRRVHKIKLGCKNWTKVSVQPGVEWSKYVDAKPCADFYLSCVERINKLRALENLLPLGRDQGKERCSDDDARTNYKKNQPHASMCGQAQNECWTANSIDEILNNCIEQHMYYKEKPCYNNNPAGCYHDQASMCGHYVNMLDKQKYGYTKAACGLYETPTGEFHSVINFFK